MYGNLVNDMLGNSSRDSRSTRGGHRRDDRGQSVYEGERDELPNMSFTKLPYIVYYL
jgi:hypothetical protein